MPIRVLVVDDSRFMVRLISTALEAAGDMEVVGYALDGQEAVLKAEKLSPDVITMDVVMPRMDGLQATRLIAAKIDIPIIIFSAYTQEGASLTVEALQAGAVDCLAKPSGERSMSLDSVADDLVRKVRGVAMQARSGSAPRPITEEPVATTYSSLPTLTTNTARKRQQAPTLVVLGASTGGIQALNAILPRFDRSVPFGIVVVQHFPQGFTAQLAERLNSVCSIQVVEAEPGQRLARATVVVAPGGSNLEITPGLRLRLTDDGSPGIMKPSIDVTFRSVAQVLGPAALGVVLTGMGKDGSAGALDIVRAGGRILVQDYRTATAYGMPRSAYETGCFEAMLPLEQIAGKILSMSKGI
jgi:two-component system, chemotaxis family, protein-glutamate methylesterase/glutaminase